MSKMQPAYPKPLPLITPLNQPFWDYARRAIFALQVCDECGDAHIPESPVCPRCLSRAQSWCPSSGRGMLESWVEFHRPYWDGFAADIPYAVCLVRLDEGPLFISNLAGEVSAARHGARMHAVFKPVTDEVTLPEFAFGQ
jgi:uncharacterized OB-fold protein